MARVPIGEIQKAVGEVKRLNDDPDFSKTTKAREDALREEQSALSSAWDAGALKKSFDIARNLLAKNVPLDIIKDSTGLSIEELESLQKP